MLSEKNQLRHLRMMKHNMRILEHLMVTVTQEQAQTWRDGPDGWSLLEILCHLRDFDRVFRDRAALIRDNDGVALEPYDHLQMVIDGAYNEQNKDEVLEAFKASRVETREFFKALTDEQWSHSAIHPESGAFGMVDQFIQLGTHDIDHIEQITRVLANYR